MATKVIPFIQDYIAQHQDDVNFIARKLSVPSTAMAAAMSEEMSHVYFNDIEGTRRVIVKNFPDAALDDIVKNSGHVRTRTDFESRRTDIENGIKPPVWSHQKLLSPTSNDIGPANLNLGSAI